MLSSRRFSGSVRCCRTDDSLRLVAEIMWKHDCNYVLIVDTDGCPIGVITEQELFAVARQGGKPLAHMSVSGIASKGEFAHPGGHTRRKLGESRSSGHTHRVPILDDEGSLVNVVNEDWLSRYLLRVGVTTRIACE